MSYNRSLAYGKLQDWFFDGEIYINGTNTGPPCKDWAEFDENDGTSCRSDAYSLAL